MACSLCGLPVPRVASTVQPASGTVCRASADSVGCTGWRCAVSAWCSCTVHRVRAEYLHSEHRVCNLPSVCVYAGVHTCSSRM